MDPSRGPLIVPVFFLLLLSSSRKKSEEVVLVVTQTALLMVVLCGNKVIYSLSMRSRVKEEEDALHPLRIDLMAFPFHSLHWVECMGSGWWL